MIPKKIHYIWFGNNPMKKELLTCMKTWEQSFLEYEFILWNEVNCPKGIFFLDEMLKRQQWAFASDFLRFYVLFNNGGIYLDTDMYFFKNIDEYLDKEYFLGKENKLNLSAGVIGCVSNHQFNKICMDFYYNLDTSQKIEEFLEKRILIPQVLNESYNKYSGNKNSIQILDPEIFYPVSFKERANVYKFIPKNENTKAIHLWVASWHNEFELISSKKYFQSFKRYLINFIKTNSKLAYSKKYFGFLFIRLIYLSKNKIRRLLKF